MDRYPLTRVLGPGTRRIGAETVDVPEEIPAHAHDYVELALVVDGRGTHVSRSGSDSASAGSVFLIRPGSWHAFEPHERMTVVNVYFDERVLFEFLPWVMSDARMSKEVMSAGTSSWVAPSSEFGDAVAWATELAERGEAPLMVSVGLLTCIMALLTDFGSPSRVEPLASTAGDAAWGAVARIKADPTASNTRNGTGFTSGWRSITAPQLEQIGRAPLGGCSTTAGPQQHSRQRNRGMGEWRGARSADQLIATIMRCRQWSRHAPQFFGASAADLRTER